MIQRRHFLTGIAAALAAPALVRASSLDYVPRLPKLIGPSLVSGGDTLITMTFSEPINTGIGAITLRRVDNDGLWDVLSGAVSIHADRLVRIRPSKQLEAGETYALRIPWRP